MRRGKSSPPGGERGRQIHINEILYGICKPDEGEIFVKGTPTAIKSPKQAIDLGIGMVHQHFMLTPVLTVTEISLWGANL